MTDFNQPNSDNYPVFPIDALTQIAQQHLEIDTLEERGSDALDFHDCSIWSIKSALKAVFLLGYSSAQQGSPEHSDEAVLARDLRIDLLEQFAQTATTDAERFVAHTSWTTEDPIATLQAFADSSAANTLTPKVAVPAQDILRRLRFNNRA
ncbi:hypothetical protein [Pseudorhodobacter sp. E13]|uniref:DUF6900 domain-containing protein n=1 Tax=Pseudorhodobacter sp. E13 TaxID=2487931 RepID=UPI0018F7AD0D|nr:hypothetical protein [Pseudorhodobacter sp. E13]